MKWKTALQVGILKTADDFITHYTNKVVHGVKAEQEHSFDFFIFFLQSFSEIHSLCGPWNPPKSVQNELNIHI